MEGIESTGSLPLPARLLFRNLNQKSFTSTPHSLHFISVLFMINDHRILVTGRFVELKFFTVSQRYGSSMSGYPYHLSPDEGAMNHPAVRHDHLHTGLFPVRARARRYSPLLYTFSVPAFACLSTHDFPMNKLLIEWETNLPTSVKFKSKYDPDRLSTLIL